MVIILLGSLGAGTALYYVAKSKPEGAEKTKFRWMSALFFTILIGAFTTLLAFRLGCAPASNFFSIACSDS